MNSTIKSKISHTAPAPSPVSDPDRRTVNGIAFAALFIGGMILSTVLGSGTFPSPFGSDASTEAYFADNQAAVLGLGVLHVLAALPLMAFVAAITRAGLARTAGFLAAAFLAISGLLDIALATAEPTGDTLHTLHYLTFAAGGQVHVPLLGILVGVSAAAFAKSAPRWTTVLGYLSAALSLASLISIVVEPAMMLLPLGRFTGILWIVVTASRLSFRK